MVFQVPPEKLHHAYILEGSYESIQFLLNDYFFQYNINQKKLDEVLFLTYDQLSIEDVRNLKFEEQEQLTIQRRFIILNLKNVTIEAQQALLKILEEPQEGIHIIIILPYIGNLIETLLSRTELISYKNPILIENKAHDFLKSNIRDRLSIIETYIKDYQDESLSNTRFVISSFLVELIKCVHNNQNLNIIERDINQDLISSLEYLNDRSPSIKMILEYLAVSLPVLS